jgi:hypothetical protein
MRTVMCLAFAATAACNWTTFDDLSSDTWVNSTSKPSVKSSDYGVAIQRGNRSGNEGRLVVIGAGQPTYSELAYNDKGDSSLPSTSLELNSQFGIGNLDPQPIVLADPTGDNVALVMNAGGSSILVLEGTAGAMNQHQVFVTPSTADAATYMQPPNRIDTGHAGEAQPIQVLVASGDLVLGTFYANVPNPQPRCKLTDAGTAITPKALGTVRRGMFDDVLAWGANGKLYKYDGDVFNGCPTMKDPIASVATNFTPGHGAQILQIDQTHVLLQGHHDGDDSAFLQVFDGTTMAAIGGPVSPSKLRTAALLTSGATTFVIAGFPTASIDGKTAGQIELHKVSLTTGVDNAAAATLHDAQPENNQSFGRAVAAMPYHGNQLIAVAADNEIFVYFRANLDDGTQVYGETRQGR